MVATGSEAFGHDIPVQIVDKSVEIFRSVDAVIYHVGVFINIKHQNWYQIGWSPHVVHVQSEGAQMSAPSVVADYDPAAHALACRFQVIHELSCSPTLVESCFQIARRFATFATEIAKVELMIDGAVDGVAFFDQEFS